jgi:spore maturation protein CgeB
VRVLVIHPGSSISTSDVHDGILPALKRQGVEVYRYNLDARIAESGAWLEHLRRKRIKRTGEHMEKFGPADILYHACQDILGRALRIQADWVVVVSGMYLHPDWMIMMKRAGIKLAVMLTESPYDDEKQGPFIQHADLAWTNERTSIPYLAQFNERVRYLPHAYDPAKHQPDLDANANAVPTHDVLFIGTGFQERIDLLRSVNWDGIDLGLYGSWDLMGSRNWLRSHIAGGYIDNRVAAEMYKRSKICLNIYRSSVGFGRTTMHVVGAESLNPRALELAASGAFQICDYRKEVEETFGALVPTFQTAEELEELIRFYLSHDIERKRMQRALPETVTGWTFDANAQQMIADLSE